MFSLSKRDKKTQLCSGIYDVWIPRVFPHNPDIGLLRKIAGHVCPGQSKIHRLIHKRPEIIEHVPVERTISHSCRGAGWLDMRDRRIGGDLGNVFHDALPGLSPVHRYMKVSIVCSNPQDSWLQRRFRQADDAAVVFCGGVLCPCRPSCCFLFLRVVGGQVRAYDLPRRAKIR
ncbi:hypothetical protein ES703_86975 [subsurface metagenome]